MEFTHFNEQCLSKMVDISDKTATKRVAVATAFIKMNPETLAKIKEGTVSKGNVLAVAQVAGIMAAKNTPSLIPMCHHIMLSGADISFDIEENGIRLFSEIKCKGETGVSVAALTIYDMCKAVQKNMVISDIHLVSKTGGKSGEYKFKE